MKVSFTVNGEERSGDVEPRMLLAHFLRDELGLTGTNIGCDTSSCGACTVLIDGRSAKACTVLAVQTEGANVTTIEGLATGEAQHVAVGRAVVREAPAVVLLDDALSHLDARQRDAHEAQVAAHGVPEFKRHDITAGFGSFLSSLFFRFCLPL